MSDRQQLLKIVDLLIELWRDGYKETTLRVIETLPPIAATYVGCRLYGAQIKLTSINQVNQSKSDQLLDHMIERTEPLGWVVTEKVKELLQMNRLISQNSPRTPPR